MACWRLVGQAEEPGLEMGLDNSGRIVVEVGLDKSGRIAVAEVQRSLAEHNLGCHRSRRTGSGLVVASRLTEDDMAQDAMDCMEVHSRSSSRCEVRTKDMEIRMAVHC